MAGGTRINPSKLLIALLIVLIVPMPITYLTTPVVKRWVSIRQLTSNDLEKRQRALRYLVSHMPADASLIGEAVDVLARADDANFQQIVDALQAADRWDREHIPDGVWLRWIGMQAEAPGVEAPVLAAQRLARMQDLADDSHVTSLLARLANHTEPDVRYNALCAAAELVLSADDRSPYLGIFREKQKDEQDLITHHADAFLYLLGQPDGATPKWLEDGTWQTKEARFDLEEIGLLLWSPEAPLRDVGCVLAVREMPPGIYAELVDQLLTDEHQNAVISGAVLAGMTGEHLGLLRDILDKQSEWAVATVLKLGLWMSDGGVRVELDPMALLARDDIPRTTVILAMLHREDFRALDALLNPHGEAPDDLAYLLEGYGWWRVLDRYLPEDAPRWRSGLNEEQQQSQIELLRDWYLLRRHQLMRRVRDEG